jgi:site-specific DNA-methyltransferase (adenine-specific)
MPPKTAVTKAQPKPKDTAKAATTTTRKRRESPARLALSTVPAHSYLAGNALVCGDNIDVLKELPEDCVDLIYLDPPFNSNQFYVAAFGDKGMVQQQLKDVWRWTVETENTYKRLPHGKLLNAINGIRLLSGETSKMAAYCVFMSRRLEQLRRVLKPTGSIYLHCDDAASHYLKLLLDVVFGADNFRNELIWKRTSGRTPAKRFGRVHESIFYYTKGTKFSWNTQWLEQGEDYITRAYRKEDSRGRYTDDQLTADGPRTGQSGEPWRGIDVMAKGNHWRTPTEGGMNDYIIKHGLIKGWPGKYPNVHDRLDALDAAGLISWPRGGKGVPRLKRYLDSTKGRAAEDVITDIRRLEANSKEKIGYPTQKPLALLERIIKASSNEGDLVLDPFCGCGTAADAAASLGRGYLGMDVSGIAVRVMEQRLTSRGSAHTPIVYGLDWTDDEWEDFERQALRTRDDSEDGVPGWAWAEDRVAGILNAIPNEVKQGDGGVDARYFGVMDTKTKKQLVIPIQVKMHRNASSVGRPDMDRLLGSQVAMQNRGVHAPMSLMVSLYPPPNSLRVFAAQQGHVTITTDEEGLVEYPVMQVLSVQEILQKGERPKLPPIDPRSLVGNTQTRF